MTTELLTRMTPVTLEYSLSYINGLIDSMTTRFHY